MACSASVPSEPRVSIAWLAGHWSTGLTETVFIEQAHLWVLRQGRRRQWWVVDWGFTNLPNYFCSPGSPASDFLTWQAFNGPDDFDQLQWSRSHLAERILLDRSDC